MTPPRGAGPGVLTPGGIGLAHLSRNPDPGVEAALFDPDQPVLGPAGRLSLP